MSPTQKILKKDNLISFQELHDNAGTDDESPNEMLIDEKLDTGRPLPNDFDSFATRILVHDAAKNIDDNVILRQKL